MDQRAALVLACLCLSACGDDSSVTDGPSLDARLADATRTDAPIDAVFGDAPDVDAPPTDAMPPDAAPDASPDAPPPQRAISGVVEIQSVKVYGHPELGEGHQINISFSASPSLANCGGAGEPLCIAPLI